MPLNIFNVARFPIKELRRLLIMLTVVTLLSGCVVGPDYGLTTSSRISNHFTNAPVSHVDGQFLEVTTRQVPAEQWWHTFADPILNDLVSRAMHQSLSLQAAYERIVESRSNFHLQTGQLLPDGIYQNEYQYLKRSPNARPFVGSNGDPFNLFTPGLSVTWELDLFGRIERSIQAAEASVELQEFDLEAIRQLLIADIASSYLRVRLLQQQISLTQESLSLQQETVKLIDNRAAAGASTELDRAQTKSFLRRSEALLASLEQQLAVEFNQLSWLLGEAPGENIIQLVGTQPLPQIPMLPAAGIPTDLLRRRPDVRRDERAVAAASARIGIAEADLYPRLSLLGDISLSAMSPSQLFQTDSLAFSIGPSFSWNLLHFGRIFSNIEIFESQFRQALLAYEQTVLLAVREVEDGLAQHHGAFRQWNSFTAAIEEDKQAVELSLKRYEIGKINFQRVLDAQQQLLLDRQQQATQQAAAIEQLIRTHKALGGDWNPDRLDSCGNNGTCGGNGSCGSSGCCPECLATAVTVAEAQPVAQPRYHLEPEIISSPPVALDQMVTGSRDIGPTAVTVAEAQPVAQPSYRLEPEIIPSPPVTLDQQAAPLTWDTDANQIYPLVPKNVERENILW